MTSIFIGCQQPGMSGVDGCQSLDQQNSVTFFFSRLKFTECQKEATEHVQLFGNESWDVNKQIRKNYEALRGSGDLVSKMNV